MNKECEERDSFGMSIGSPDFIPRQEFRGFLVTPGRGWYLSSVAKKNGVRLLRNSSQELLRPEGSSCPGSVLRRGASLSGAGDPTCSLQKVRRCEAGKTSLAGRQSLLHEAICLLCGETMPCFHDCRCGERSSAQLEDGQGAGKAVHEGTVAEGRDTGTGG